MSERWKSFGWDAHDVDGHDVPALVDALNGFGLPGQPHVIVAHTTFGKGVSYMENQIRWHYLPMSDSEFATAMAEVEAS